jgi:predicted RNA-binding protein with PIN domain
MAVSYVVDGYNLLFHLGLVDRRTGATALEQARRRLVEQVRDTIGQGNPAITVVFDSARNRRTMPAPREYLGIEIRFAGGGQLADDVIETLIAQCARPQQLVVISNDRRVQDAARRRGARAWTCDEFLEHGEPRRSLAPRPSRETERPMPSRAEVEHWLAEFGDLADDPAFREVFDPFPFADEE